MRLPAIDEGHLRTGLPNTIGIAAVFSGKPPDLTQVRSRVQERWGRLDRMHQVLKPPAGSAALSGHRWDAAGTFDPALHVTATDQPLEPLLTAGIAHPLPRHRPLWRLILSQNATEAGEHAVVLLAHHALLDGRSLETLLRLLMDDAPPPPPPGPAATPMTAPPRPSVAALCRELHALSIPGQSLPAASAGRPQPSLAVMGIDPQVMRAARRRPARGRGATLNELLLSAYAGALRSRYGTLRSWPKGPAALYATVPVDLRSRHTMQQLGNIVTTLRIPLPIDTDSPADRLQKCQGLVAALQHRCDTHRTILPALETATRAVPWLAGAMAKRLTNPRVNTSVCTAFKWRDNPSHLYGRPLSHIVAAPQLFPPGTANLCLVHTADTYTLTVVSHTGAGDAAVIGEAVAQELKAISASDTAP